MAVPLIVLNAGIGLWALAAHWVHGLRIPALVWSTVVAQAMIFVQATVGALALAEGSARPGIHFFYGFLAITGVALLYAWRSYEALSEWRYLIYGLGGLFIAGLLLRAHTLPVAAEGAAFAVFGFG